MQLQFITTHEELQQIFDNLQKNSLMNYKTDSANIAEPVIITGEQLCEKIGITIQTLIRWRKKGRVPYISLGSAQVLLEVTL